MIARSPPRLDESRKDTSIRNGSKTLRESQERETMEKIQIGEMLLKSTKTSLKMVQVAEQSAKHECGDLAEKLRQLENAANEFDTIAVSLLNEFARIPPDKRSAAQQALLQHYKMHDISNKSQEFSERLHDFERQQAKRTARFTKALKETLDKVQSDAELLPKVREVAVEILPESQLSPRVSFHELSKTPPRQYKMHEKAQSTPALFSFNGENSSSPPRVSLSLHSK